MASCILQAKINSKWSKYVKSLILLSGMTVFRISISDYVINADFYHVFVFLNLHSGAATHFQRPVRAVERLPGKEKLVSRAQSWSCCAASHIRFCTPAVTTHKHMQLDLCCCYWTKQVKQAPYTTSSETKLSVSKASSAWGGTCC